MSAERNILNLAGYCFFPFVEAPKWRYPLRDLGRSLGLTGTILSGPEGVNVSMAGTPEALQEFLMFFHDKAGVPLIQFKESWTEKSPFKRFLVKIKKEIVTMGQGEIDVQTKSSNHLPAPELKKWLDEKKDFTLLDTRNDFEIKLGKFSQAIDLGVRSFREFARRSQELPQELKKKPLVMYCTGGIRCEKASVYFRERLGFEEVYQLDGGILRYFEQVGKEHYQGECFVFDHRIGIDSELSETGTTQCIGCRTPLRKHEVPEGTEGFVLECCHCN